METSLALIMRGATDRAASIIDVGGAESTLVDDLLDRGFENIRVSMGSRQRFRLVGVGLGNFFEPEDLYS